MAQALVSVLLMLGALTAVWMVEADGWLIVCAILVGMLMVHVGFLAHEAGHGAVTRVVSIDRTIAWTCWTLLTGLSDSWWQDKHQRHHRHTNAPERDADFYPMFCYSEMQAAQARGYKRIIARYQVIFFLVLTAFTRLYFQLLSVRFLLRTRPYPGLELSAIMLHHLVFLVLPSLALGPAKAAMYISVSYIVCGLYMGVVFAPNHIAMPLTISGQYGVPRLVQVMATRNVKIKRWQHWFWGGLNYQIEHHLFPDIARNQLHAASKHVREFCTLHDLPYHSVGAITAWREVLYELHRVGAPLRSSSITTRSVKPKC